MSDDSYRGALTAAQSRIESLEREVQAARAALPPAPKGTPIAVQILACLGGLALLGFLFATALVAFTSFILPRGPRTPDPWPVDTTPAPKPTLGASWYTAGRSEPQIAADLDDDGRKDLVSLFWSAPDDAPLYVAALHRETLESIWVAGPYPSQWAGSQTHLVVTAGHVVVADSRETLHVLESRSGNELAALPFAGGAARLCVRAKHPEQLLVSRNYDDFTLLDLATRTLRKLGSTENTDCLEERPPCKPGQTVSPCLVSNDRVPKQGRPRGFDSYGGLRWDDTVLSAGSRSGGPGDTSAPWLAVSSAQERKLRWSTAAVVDGDLLHLATRTNDTLTSTAVITFYQRSTGDFRLVARSNDTGAVLWNVGVGSTREGSYASLYVLDGDVFVHADQRMYAYDRETGAVRKTSSGI